MSADRFTTVPLPVGTNWKLTSDRALTPTEQRALATEIDYSVVTLPPGWAIEPLTDQPQVINNLIQPTPLLGLVLAAISGAVVGVILTLITFGLT